MRFCANVSILFTDAPFLARFARARAVGFTAVEFWWPAGEDLGRVEAAIAEAGLEVALFNFDAGEMAKGDRGLTNDPDREARFRENVPVALALAHRLGCPRLNALVGLERAGASRDAQLERARANVAWAADRAAELGIGVTIEAINTVENGPYLLTSTEAAAAFVRAIGRPNVQLQYDVYHMCVMGEDPCLELRRHVGWIAHVQIADFPGRNEPGTGTIPFGAVFTELERQGYRGLVGLEYRPSRGDTEASFGWLPVAARGGDLAAAALTVTR